MLPARTASILRLKFDEPVPREIEETYSVRSGPFLLRIPSGRLMACALDTDSPESGEPPETRTFDVPPGDYALAEAVVL